MIIRSKDVFHLVCKVVTKNGLLLFPLNNYLVSDQLRKARISQQFRNKDDVKT